MFSPLEIAVRCASLYVDGVDVTAMSAADATLMADAITAGIADYWSLVPDYVKAPQGEAPIPTVATQSYVYLPAPIEQLLRPPRLRLNSVTEWCELYETVEWHEPASIGQPTHYRLQSIFSDPPFFDYAEGGSPSLAEPRIQLYPTPAAVYYLDIWARYAAPVVRVKHLSGRVNTITLPIPEDHIRGMVVPLCAPHFLLHPKKRAALSEAVATAAAIRGAATVRGLPSRLSTSRPRVRMRVGY